MTRSTERTRAWLVIARAAVIALLAGCGGSGTVTPPPPPPPPPPAVRARFVIEPSGAEAQVALTPAVRVVAEDAAGAPVTTESYQVAISLGANPTGATLSGTLTAQTTNGEARLPTTKRHWRRGTFDVCSRA